MAIALRKPAEIEKLRAANVIVGDTLARLEKETRPGMSLKELDAMAEDFIRSRGARPSFKGLYGFPNAVCTSLNEVIIHGIPTDYKLQEGDVIGYDIGTEIDGWYGDAAVSVAVGEVSSRDEASSPVRKTRSITLSTLSGTGCVSRSSRSRWSSLSSSAVLCP